MLDTYGRKYVNKWIDSGANLFSRMKFTPNAVTKIAFLLGIIVGPLVYLDKPIIATIVLWISGYLDAVDGALARKTKKTSSWGTLMDITFDRLVEISVIMGFAFYDLDRSIYLLAMTSAIIFSMTVFLAVGALVDAESQKSFYYQAGVMERTEGFLFFTAMILIPSQFKVLAVIYAGLVYFTGGQRLLEARDVME
ncbi:MAG: CDP-alcohol phosphatidyltransferase family protein [Tissierellales bacterium]|jgi:CDP-diacylglycerol--glycerol-3-phosphate 3-phosphatidyltransferase|nr:CDP-alcohol phosphatidyltransferase family protein [Tissierellales bacterium]